MSTKKSRYDLCMHASRMVCPLDDRYDMCANPFCDTRDKDKRKREGYWAPPRPAIAPLIIAPDPQQAQLF